MTMASGAAVMTKLIMAKAEAAQPTATRNAGCRAISPSGRPLAAPDLACDVRNVEEEEHSGAEQREHGRAKKRAGIGRVFKKIGGVDHRLRPEHGGDDAAGHDKRDGPRPEGGARRVGGREAELLDERLREADQKRADAEEHEARRGTSPSRRAPRRAKLTSMPVMKPARRPTLRISSAAGTVPQAVPTTKAVIGSVASDLSSPRKS